MERLLERLPRKPYSALTRYALTTLFVLGALLVMMLMRLTSPLQGYFLLYPAIFMATVIFNKGSGYYATALAVIGALAIGVWQEGYGFLIEAQWSLLLFGVIGLGIAWITESMRRSWERAKRAEEAKDVLMRELQHRTKNDFAVAASLLQLQARSQTDKRLAEALTSAVGRLQVLSNMHETSTVAKEGDTAMRPYLQSLCTQLNQSIGEARNVIVTVDCDDLELPRSRAIPVGLIINELATNAYKHAFPEAFAAGEIHVQLRRRNGITLIVEDNGKGCSKASREGVGSRLIKELVGQLEGSFHREDAQPGCRVTITIPDKAQQPL